MYQNFFTPSYMQSLIASLNNELDKLSIWLCANKLSLNVQKTYFMVFQRAKIKIANPINVTMNNCCLKKTGSLKYLGVIIRGAKQGGWGGWGGLN